MELRDHLPQFNDVAGRLLLLQLNHEVLQLVDSLGQSLSVGHHWIHRKISSTCRQRNVVLHLMFELGEVVVQIRQLLVQMLVLKHQTLLLLVTDSYLLNKVFGSLFPLAISLKSGNELVSLEQLPLILMDDGLELLPLPLQLNLVAFNAALQVQVLLKKLVPSPLALALTFGELLDDSPASHILLR